MTDGVTVLGIRHHGPGSARSVLQVLEQLQPDLVFVEGPPDAQELLQFAALPDMRPPVALVIYPPEQPRLGVFYPFATFSPEWVAIRHALRHEISVRFCDLPTSITCALMLEKSESMRDESGDPIALLAEAAGEDDPERWWERMVEQRHGGARDVFLAVSEAMRAVRESLPPASLHEQQREAAMRQAIRRAQSEGFSNVVVVCGAWHAPALDVLPARKDDEKVLRGLPRIKVSATWVPWTASRLAYTSGYGAGVESPAWYRHLWQSGGDVTQWLTAAARLLRVEDLDASPSQVIDAVRLTEALAALRGRSQPSLSEISDATLSVLCGGETARANLIHRKLIVGEDMGQLPAHVPAVPLQRDIEQQARRLRLRMDVEADRSLDLDLREAHQLEQSRFLHRLRIIDVDWGRLQPLPGGRLGTFHELWSLHWRPEMILHIVEACVYGNTLPEAAAARAIARGESLTDLGRTASLVQLVLLANLPAALARLVQLLGDRAAESTDVGQLLRALPALVSSLRYGDVRQTDTSSLRHVFDALLERATAGLPVACAGLDDEAAESMARDIVAAAQSLGTLANELDARTIDDWWTAHTRALDRRDVAPLIAGTLTRLLLTAERLSAEEADERVGRALARGSAPPDAALWLDGFLRPATGGSGLVLATSSRLFDLIDTWLCGLPAEYFSQVLPLLRRTTATFSTTERRQIAERVTHGTPSILRTSDELDPERVALVSPIVRSILGPSG